MFGFWVGTPQSVHRGKFGDSCVRAFKKKLGVTFDDNGVAPYCSKECPWQGLSGLYELVAQVSGEKNAREFEYSEAFLPVDTEHRKFNFNILGTSFLRVSSLETLCECIETVARAKEWPSLNERNSNEVANLLSSKSLFDDDVELFTYCEMLAAIAVAKERSLPLWIA